jgi:hypothetical protein
MMWEPISEDDLVQLIRAAESKMLANPSLHRFWSRIKIMPEKWHLSPWGDEGGGFWVVAVFGQTCVYFNDIEDGFNTSRYRTFGQIDEYWCDQTELEFCILWILQSILHDSDRPLTRSGPPEAVFPAINYD